MWRFSCLLVLGLLLGCSKPTSSELAKQVVAQADLSDEEAIQKIGVIYFPEDTVSAKKQKDGQVHLTVTTHHSKTAETKMYGSGSAKDSHKFVALFPALLNSRGTIEQARQRKLGRFTIKLRDTALNENNQPTDFDLFGFTVNASQFDQFLNAARVENTVRGDPRDKIRPVCTIDVDNFDQLTFSNKH